MDREPSITSDERNSNYTHSTANTGVAQDKKQEILERSLSLEGRTIALQIQEKNGDVLSLRKIFPKEGDRELLSFLLTQYRLQNKAQEKWSYADKLLYTERSYQQATSEKVSAYKATSIPKDSTVLVGCSGLGGELIELARMGHTITAVDMDPEMIAIAKHNLQSVLGEGAVERVEFICEEFMHFLSQTIKTWDRAYMDPDRRDARRRHIDMNSYSPSYEETVLLLKKHVKDYYFKVAPAIDYIPLWEEGMSVEIIQEKHTVKEALIYTSSTQERKATLITETDIHTYTTSTIISLDSFLTPIAGMKLYEPVGAIRRAGLVGNIAKKYELSGIHTASSLLVAEHNISSPFVQAFSIIDVLPFHPKTIRAYCKKRGISTCTIKKRFFPIEPHSLYSILKMKEGSGTILFFTTIGMDTRVCIICSRIPQ